MLSRIIYITIFGLLINFCDAKKYRNYTLFRGIPVNQTHLNFFTHLRRYFDVDYWIYPGTVYQPIDFVINPRDKAIMLSQASDLGVNLNAVMEDVQKYFDQQTVQKYSRINIDSMNWNSFYRLNDIYDWIEDIAREHPSDVTVKTIGRTYENRSIIAVQVILKKESPSPAIMVEGGIHGREWISPAFVTYLMNQIINAPLSNDIKLRYIAYNYEWYFVPVLNPDGYEYTHTEDRLWRKNRRGPGIDLNRNFDIEFGEGEENFFPSSPTYSGPQAFSERESRAMAQLIKLKAKNLKYYFSFHSYGQCMILPPAKLMASQNQYLNLYWTCEEAADKIYKHYNTNYSARIGSLTLGNKVTGMSAFWAKKAYNVPYVIVFELRDEGYYGYALPPDEILPTCEETLDGLKTILITSYRSSGIYSYLKKCNPIVIGLNLLLFIIVYFE